MSISSEQARHCCLCGSGAAPEPFRVVDGQELQRCGGCGLVFLSGRTRSVDQTRFFRDAENPARSSSGPEYWGFPRLYEKHRAVFDSFFEERLTRIRSAHPGIGSLLDVGAGYGLWLNFCTGRIPQACGIELIPEIAAEARSRFGLQIETGNIESGEPFQNDRMFDAATLCDVLEHLENPAKALSLIRERLRPKGVLYIQVPNEVTWRSFAFRKQWGLPYHVWHFTESSLARLARSCGYEVVRCWTGVQGVIGVHEAGKALWAHRLGWFLARKLGAGNRLQMLLRVSA